MNRCHGGADNDWYYGCHWEGDEYVSLIRGLRWGSDCNFYHGWILLRGLWCRWGAFEEGRMICTIYEYVPLIREAMTCNIDKYKRGDCDLYLEYCSEVSLRRGRCGRRFDLYHGTCLEEVTVICVLNEYLLLRRVIWFVSRMNMLYLEWIRVVEEYSVINIIDKFFSLLITLLKLITVLKTVHYSKVEIGVNQLRFTRRLTKIK